MSTRSIIAKQIGEDQYLTIFCHYNGYPDDNGARLVKHYNTPERVDALLALGDLEILREKTEPSPQTPHTADAPQPGVTVAMRRDMELSGCEAVEMIREELIEPEYEGIEYTYIFNQDGKWLHFPVGEEYEWRDLKEDLENDTIHIAEPDAELMEALGLTGEEWDENLEEDNIKQEMYGGI